LNYWPVEPYGVPQSLDKFSLKLRRGRLFGVLYFLRLAGGIVHVLDEHPRLLPGPGGGTRVQ
jgi:hypothetical protein